MMKCSICKENLAVVFITKIVNGKQTQEGLCFSCAKKRGIQPINQILEQTGISEDEIDDLNKQMSSFFEEMNINSEDEEGSDIDVPNNTNPLFNLINKSFLKSGDNLGLKDSKDLKLIVNKKAAAAIGIDVPEAVLSKADEVIE